MPISSLPIPLAREVRHGSRRDILTVFRTTHRCVITQAAECL
jgi:hypothetical protein